MVGHQLGVLPDTDDVGEEEECGIFVNCFAFGLRDVGFDAAGDFGLGARWFTTVAINCQ